MSTQETDDADFKTCIDQERRVPRSNNGFARFGWTHPTTIKHLTNGEMDQPDPNSEKGNKVQAGNAV
jgi:hypothetical protein